MKELTVIGRAEKADLIDLGLHKVPAKIDTGADASSIWASRAEVKDGKLSVVFFDHQSDFYTEKEYTFAPGMFTITRVANSFGHREIRYKVKLRIKIKGRTINGTFTLANRSQKLYPILIGRSLLRGKFIVDVVKGSPLWEEEKERAVRLREELRNTEGGAI